MTCLGLTYAYELRCLDWTYFLHMGNCCVLACRRTKFWHTVELVGCLGEKVTTWKSTKILFCPDFTLNLSTFHIIALPRWTCQCAFFSVSPGSMTLFTMTTQKGAVAQISHHTHNIFWRVHKDLFICCLKSVGVSFWNLVLIILANS